VENKNLDEGVESDGVESDDDEAENAAHQLPQALAFEIDPDIDINSQALIDMVSTNPNVVEAVPQLFTPAMAPETFTVDPNWDW
jgi:hypothetical protein